MRRSKFLLVGFILCTLLFMMPVHANIPEIVIDGVVVQERKESKIVEMAHRVQDWYIADRQAGYNWEYMSSGKSYRTFSEAFAAGARYTNCSDGVNKVLRECGLLPYNIGFFFGSANGTITWLNNAKAEYEQYADIYSFADGTTVGSLINSGFLQPGDVVTYLGFAHTNLYLGDDIWFDTGHANCTRSSGDHAPFRTFVGHADKSSLKVGCVVRVRDQYDEPIKIETIYEPDIIIEDISDIIIEEVETEIETEIETEVESEVGTEVTEETEVRTQELK